MKPGTESEIKLNIFGDNVYSDISAVIFSCTLTLGKLTSLAISNGRPSLNKVKYLSDGLIVLHNPNAKNLLALDIFSKTNALQIYTIDNLNYSFYAEILPVISRANSFLLNFVTQDQLFTIMLNYNSGTVDLSRMFDI